MLQEKRIIPANKKKPLIAIKRRSNWDLKVPKGRKRRLKKTFIICCDTFPKADNVQVFDYVGKSFFDYLDLFLKIIYSFIDKIDFIVPIAEHFCHIADMRML